MEENGDRGATHPVAADEDRSTLEENVALVFADTLAVDFQSVRYFDRQFLHSFSGAADDQVACVFKLRGVLFR